MITVKLYLLIFFQLFIVAFSHGQTKITKEGFEKAVDFANYKYVTYSLTSLLERQKFIENCDCDNNPTFELIQSAIRKTKTKTIAFSKEFNNLKNLDLDLYKENIAAFLTDSIFSNKINSNYNEVFNYGKRRENDPGFIKYKNDLSEILISSLNNHTIIAQKIEIIQQDAELDESIPLNLNNTSPLDSIISQINIVSIIISILSSLLLIGFLYFRFFKNYISDKLKKYIHKKVSGSYFDKRFDQNQIEVDNLRNEIIELKKQIQNRTIEK